MPDRHDLGPDLASQASVTSYEAQALVFPLGLKEDPDRYKVFEMGKQKHARYCGRALRLVREAKAAGRLEEAKAALREHQRVRRQAMKAKAAA
jgi:hypothetical protein